MATSGEDDPTGTGNGIPFFPDLDRGVNCEKTSDETDAYNCIGWALEDDQNWWCHEPDGTWPHAIDRLPTIAALVAVFEWAGYSACADGTPEPGYDTVVLYAMANGNWSHAARLRPSGDWTSKLGPYEDIRHDIPALVCGVQYGDVHCYMRRKHGQKTGNPAGPAEQPPAGQRDAGTGDAGDFQNPPGGGEADRG